MAVTVRTARWCSINRWCSIVRWCLTGQSGWTGHSGCRCWTEGSACSDPYSEVFCQEPWTKAAAPKAAGQCCSAIASAAQKNPVNRTAATTAWSAQGQNRCQVPKSMQADGNVFSLNPPFQFCCELAPRQQIRVLPRKLDEVRVIGAVL